METQKKYKKEIRNEEVKRDYIHRLNRIDGQVKGVKQMILDDRTFEDIVMQTLSITNAMKGLSTSLIRDYMNSNVIPNDERTREEMVRILEWMDKIK